MIPTDLRSIPLSDLSVLSQFTADKLQSGEISATEGLRPLLAINAELMRRISHADRVVAEMADVITELENTPEFRAVRALSMLREGRF